MQVNEYSLPSMSVNKMGNEYSHTTEKIVSEELHMVLIFAVMNE